MTQRISWSGIVGHKKTIARLKQTIANDRVPHSLIFAGKDGIGKKLAARIFAAALLCKNRDLCGECESCRLFAAGSHPDYAEILPEGKTLKSIKIDQIREMQKEAARFPILSSCRVFVVDDAHLMNEAAGNSLLKTIEEPTGDIKFIFVTSNPDALLSTVVSRSVPITFGQLADEETEIVIKNLGFTDRAAEFAAAADGSPGYALRLKDENGLAIFQNAADFLTNIEKFNIDAALNRSEEFAKWPKEQINDWLMHLNSLLRDLLILSAEAGKVYTDNAMGGRLIRIMPFFTKEKLLLAMAHIADSRQKFSANVNVQLFMDSFFIRMIEIIGR